MSVGATGGGSTDTLDAHIPVTDPDIMRNWNMYESLAVRSPDFKSIDYLVAESIEPAHAGNAGSWLVTLRQGVEFHNGKTVAPEDVIFSLQADPRSQGPEDRRLVDRLHRHQGPQARSARTQVLIPLKAANAAFVDELGQYFNAIVPVGYDPKKPVGTGAFMYESFTPGQQSVFKRFPNYWQEPKPYVDELTIIDFTDDTARVNALLGGQVQAIDNLPTAQIGEVEGYGGYKVLISQTGQWQPFTMRVDVAPFNDVRVRQAMRLIVDRPQMVLQVLSGQGRVANDMYAPFDPGYNHVAAPAPPGHRAGQVAAQAGRPGGADASSSPPRRCSTASSRRREVFAQQATARRRQGQAQPGQHQRLLRAQLPQVAVRPGLLGDPRVPAAGGAGQPAGGAVQRDPLAAQERRAQFTKLIAQATAELDATQAQRAAQRGDEDRVRHRRVHHPVLLQPDRRLHEQDGRLRGGRLGLPAGQLLVQERGYLAS